MSQLLQFKNQGILNGEFSNQELEPIKNEITKIQENFANAISHNNKLAGNLEKEYQLIENCEYIANLLSPHIQLIENGFNYYKGVSETYFKNKNFNLKLESLWVNFQKKYEFNPPHVHNGIYSFVIWVDIPYDIKDEMNQNHSKYSNNNIPGHFQFIYIDSKGSISFENIPVDKTFNNKFIIFPSHMFHAVYPFYTSDKYRISVSGNFGIDI